jgi:hypothetical protein
VGRDPGPAAKCRASVYARLNQILDEQQFDRYVEGLCQRFYPSEGRPGLPPGRYFRLLLIGYFEGLDAERGIAWRAGDSFAVRECLGLMTSVYRLRRRDAQSRTIRPLRSGAASVRAV